MKSTSPALPLEQLAHRASASGLAWTLAWVTIAGAVAALGIAIRQAAISGDYGVIVTHQTLTPFITAGFAVIGALVASRHPRHPIGWIFTAIGILYSLVGLASAVTMASLQSSPLYSWANWLGSWIWFPANLLPVTFVSLIFPDGHLPSPRWRFVGWSAALGMAMVMLGVMFHPGPLVSLGLEAANPFGIPAATPALDRMLTLGSVFLAAGVFGSQAALLFRFRRSDSEGEQVKWLVYALGISVFVGVLTSLFVWLWPDFRWGLELSIVATNLCILGIAIAAAIAILRHRLYDIDLIIQRTLVYGALMVGIAALYGLIVGSLGVIFQSRSNMLVSLLATGAAAILVQPMRDGLQRLVSRLSYGDRDDPYAVLSGLSRRLEGVLSPESALPTVVETIAHALKLPYVTIALNQEDGLKIVASHGAAADALLYLPLIYQGKTIGQLRLSIRAPGESFTPAEERLLQDIARHIGVTAHSILLAQDLRRLAEDLQRSREALVKSREEERRRLRRDLHDELGPHLASLKLNIDVARNMVRSNPDAADAFLSDLRTQCQAAIVDIRRLVFDLRPPALDELGLIGAIEEYTCQLTTQDSLRIKLNSPSALPALPAAVEVAAYRIVLEALTNYIRHSQGKNCQVNMAIKGNQLQIEVRDDGVGLPEEVQAGVGLSSMRERAAELGGTCEIDSLPQQGTRVLARLPLE